MAKVILLALAVFLAFGLVRGANEAQSAECRSMPAITAALDAHGGIDYKILSGSDLKRFEIVAAAQGQKAPAGVTRAIMAMSGTAVWYGFEIAGCVSGPFTLQAGPGV